MAPSRVSVRAVLTLLAVAAAAIVASLRQSPRSIPVGGGTASPGAARTGAVTVSTGGNEAFLAAVGAHAHDQRVSVHATVMRVLSDDREGSPHQRFLLSVGNGPTVLVAHNLALASRVPVRVGDTVLVVGEYVWTPKGGTLHWTHLDPAGRHPAGYIELRGRRYQ